MTTTSFNDSHRHYRPSIGGRGGFSAFTVLAMALLPLAPATVLAVQFYSSADPAKNSTPPSGVLAESGWQWQGYWGSFTGTLVGPHHFLTAKHAGGSVGGIFTFQGAGYTAVARTVHPSADLAIWQVAETFPTWAHLYTATDEVGKSFTVFGRGLNRGTEVNVTGASPTALRGWRWGASDGKLRWGENVVDAVVPASTSYPTELLYAAFDRLAGENEAAVATGDSGGGVFIRAGTVWKLAGISLATDGYFSLTGVANSWFNASIFDAGGLYLGSNAGASHVVDTEADVPCGFYFSRLSSYAGWVYSVVELPAPPALLRVVSRKTHGAAGDFDLPLPMVAPYGIEGRFGRELAVVFTFDRELAQASVEVRQGSLRVISANIAGSQVVVRCASVANPQWITLALTDVIDIEGGFLEAVPVTFGVLGGDVNRNGALTSTDVTSVQWQIGRPVTASNFRADVTANGYITSADVSAVQALIGSYLR